jgi:hypothetical protein
MEERNKKAPTSNFFLKKNKFDLTYNNDLNRYIAIIVNNCLLSSSSVRIVLSCGVGVVVDTVVYIYTVVSL